MSKTLVFTREICYNTDATHTVSGASYLYAAAFLHVLFVSIIVISRLPLDGVIPAVCVATAAILTEGVFLWLFNASVGNAEKNLNPHRQS